jgi:hypothetical protein
MDSPFNTYKRLHNHYLFHYGQNTPQAVDHFIFCTRPTDCSQVPKFLIFILYQCQHIFQMLLQGLNFNNTSWGFSYSRIHNEQRTLNSYFYTMHYNFGFTNFSIAPVIVYPNCHDNTNL